MVRHWICLLCTAAMLLAAAGKAEALQERGTVRIVPSWCGCPVSGGTVSLRYVGTISEEGYYLTDGLADWSASEEDLDSGDWIGWIARTGAGKQIISPIEGEGGAVFSDLEPGIYLVEQEAWAPGYRPFESFLLRVPEGENWDVYRNPDVACNEEPPRTGDRPAPILGAMGIGLSIACLMVLVDKYSR